MRFFFSVKIIFLIFKALKLVRFRELSRDHHDQLDEFLASDQQLKAEIEYDLRKLEVSSCNRRDIILIIFTGCFIFFFLSLCFFAQEIEENEKRQRALAEERERAERRRSIRQSAIRRKSQMIRDSALPLRDVNTTPVRPQAASSPGTLITSAISVSWTLFF